MPCTYYTREEEMQMAADRTRELVTQVNELTRLLCGVMHNVSDVTPLIREIPGLREWWVDHQKRDKIAGRR